MKLPSIEFMMIAARGVALVLALITLAWVIVRWRRDTTRDAQRVFEQLDLVRAELLQLQGQMVSMPSEKKVESELRSRFQPQSTPGSAHYENATERAVKSEHRHVSAPAVETIKPNSMTNAAPRGYEVAARLARSGAAVEELMSTCALSRHEAELLVRLHAGMKSMQPPNTASAKNEKAANVSNSSPRANSNLNQLKNIGDRSKTTIKPATSLTSRPAAALRPAQHQRVSLVG